MAVRVIRETNRVSGLTPTVAVIAGQPLVLASASTVKPYDDATFADVPFAIAAESTAQPPIAPLSGLTAGEGYNYTDFARGGLVGGFSQGSELELYDDGRGAPYEPADTYVLNRPVYAKENGKVTSAVGGGRQLIGVVTDFEGSPVTRLRVKFSI